MLRIVLESVWDNHPKKGTYTIYLDPDHRWEFSQRKQADEFLVKVSNYLTKGLEILNSKYTEAFTVYRRMIFAIDKPFIRNAIETNIAEINKQFDWLLSGSSFGFNPDRETMVFPKINFIYERIYQMLSNVRTVADLRKETILKHEIDGLLMQLEIFYQDYEKFRLELRNYKECKIVQLRNIG